MYYVLYDKNFTPLGNRKTYPVESWSLRRKANSFDELVITGYPIEFDVADAMYVSLNNDNGRIKYIALSGIPITEKGKTKINAVDLKSLLNNEVVIDFLNLTVNKVSDIYVDLINQMYSQINNSGIDISNVVVDVSEIDNIIFNPESIIRSLEIGNVLKTIQGINAFYNVYMDIDISITTKELIYKFRKLDANTINLKLSDFDTTNIKKVNNEINRIICYNNSFNIKETYYLLNDNTVRAENDVVTSKIIYPAKVKIIQAEDFNKAKTQALEELLKNRYNESIEINLDNKMGYILNDLNFGFYGRFAGYRDLPLTEIFEDGKGIRKLKFGSMSEVLE